MCRAIEEMLNQAVLEHMKLVAQRLLAAGESSLEVISDLTGLSMDEVSKIQSESCA